MEYGLPVGSKPIDVILILYLRKLKCLGNRPVGINITHISLLTFVLIPSNIANKLYFVIKINKRIFISLNFLKRIQFI